MAPKPVAQSDTQKEYLKGLEATEGVWPLFPRDGKSQYMIPGKECPLLGEPETEPDVPALEPPLMRFTYPPQTHDGLEMNDENMLNKMLDDLERQGDYMTERMGERKASITEMARNFMLAEETVEEEEREWQEFLELIIRWGGPKMAAFWADVDRKVEEFRVHGLARVIEATDY